MLGFVLASVFNFDLIILFWHGGMDVQADAQRADLPMYRFPKDFFSSDLLWGCTQKRLKAKEAFSESSEPTEPTVPSEPFVPSEPSEYSEPSKALSC